MTIPSESTASAPPASVLRPRAPPPSVLTAIQRLGMDKSLLNTTLRTKAGERRLHHNLFYERMRQRKEEEERRRRQNCFLPLRVVEFMSCGSDKKGGFGCSDGDDSIAGQDTKISSLSGLDVVDKEIQRLEAARQQAQVLLQESENQLKLLQKAKTDHCPQQPPPSIASPSAAMGINLRSPQSHRVSNVPTPRTSDFEHVQPSQQRSNNDSNSKRLFTLERQVINRHEQPYQTLLENHQANANADNGGPGTVVLDDGITVTPQVWSPAQQASFQRKNQMYRDLQKPIEESIELLKAPTLVEQSDVSDGPRMMPQGSPASNGVQLDEESLSNSILVTVDDKSSDEVEVEIPSGETSAPRPEVTKPVNAVYDPVVSASHESNPHPSMIRPSDGRNGHRPEIVAALVDLDSGCDETSTVVGPVEKESMVSPEPDAKIHAEADAVEVTCDSTSFARSTKSIRKSSTWEATSVHRAIGTAEDLRTPFAAISQLPTGKTPAMEEPVTSEQQRPDETAALPEMEDYVFTAKQPEDVSTKPQPEENQCRIPGVKNDVRTVQTNASQLAKRESPKVEEISRPNCAASNNSSHVVQYDVPMVQGFSFNSILSESRVVVKGEPISPNTLANRSMARSSALPATSEEVSKPQSTFEHGRGRSSSHSLASVEQQRSIRSQRSNRVEETRAAFESPKAQSSENGGKAAAETTSKDLGSRREQMRSANEQPRLPTHREPQCLENENDEGSLPPSPRHVVDSTRAGSIGFAFNSSFAEKRSEGLGQYESRQDATIVPRSPDGIRVGAPMLTSQRPKPENLHSPSSKLSAASRLLEHQMRAARASTKQPSKPKEREFNKLKHLLDQIDYHHHQLHQGAPGSSDEVAGLVVAFGAPKSPSGRPSSSRAQNPTPPAPVLDPPSSSYEVKLRDHHKLCESPPARTSRRVARLETLRRSLEILDDTQPTQPTKNAAPRSPPRHSRYPSQGRRRQPLDASPTASPRLLSKPAMLSPTTTDDWDLLMQVRAAILGGETSPIFGSESERVVLWPSK